MKSIFTVIALVVFASAGASAAKGKDLKVKKAESAMMTACKKEYPEAVKGKKFEAVAEWVETEERGANKDQF